MRKLLLALAATAGFAAFSPLAHAQYYGDHAYRGDREVIVERAPKRNLNDGYDRVYNRNRTRRVYIIEHGRPVRRDVFFDERGRYYRVVEGRPVFIRERVFETYPERYYYRDGRPRVGVSINF